VDLQHVRYFVAVFEHGSINAAAAAVGAAQPTISQALRSLERELKAPLFYRIGRGMVPTSAGHALAGPARMMLRDIATAAGAVPDAEGHLRGQVDLRAHPAVSTGLLPRIVAAYHRRHPKVRVSIGTLDDETRAAGLLRDAACEIVVAHLPLPVGDETDGPGAGGTGPGDSSGTSEDAGGLETLELGTQEYALALPPEGGSPAVEGLAWANLDTPMTVVPQGNAHATRMVAAMNPAQQARRPAVVLQNREARLAFALAGVAATWIERSTADIALSRGARVRIMEPALPAPYGLAFDPGSLSPAAAAFVAVAAEVAAGDSGTTGDAAVGDAKESAADRNASAAGDS
jgi:DNA-binding transcriptional LysR family regulator